MGRGEPGRERRGWGWEPAVERWGKQRRRGRWGRKEGVIGWEIKILVMWVSRWELEWRRDYKIRWMWEKWI
jgi:hypothetical protein